MWKKKISQNTENRIYNISLFVLRVALQMFCHFSSDVWRKSRHRQYIRYVVIIIFFFNDGFFPTGTIVGDGCCCIAFVRRRRRSTPGRRRQFATRTVARMRRTTCPASVPLPSPIPRRCLEMWRVRVRVIEITASAERRKIVVFVYDPYARTTRRATTLLFFFKITIFVFFFYHYCHLNFLKKNLVFASCRWPGGARPRLILLLYCNSIAFEDMTDHRQNKSTSQNLKNK